MGWCLGPSLIKSNGVSKKLGNLCIYLAAQKKLGGEQNKYTGINSLKQQLQRGNPTQEHVESHKLDFWIFSEISPEILMYSHFLHKYL